MKYKQPKKIEIDRWRFVACGLLKTFCIPCSEQTTGTKILRELRCEMEAVTGIFTSFESARRAAEQLRSGGITEDNLNFLTPAAGEEEVHRVPTEDAEQPGMGKAVGGVVGAAVGSAGGAMLGMAAASAFVPGVGPVVAIGLSAAALLGVGGAVGGAAAGGALEESLTDGLPKDELFVYEDALREGRTVIIALAKSAQEAEAARNILSRHGAESIDGARERWWVGLRDSEKEHYIRDGQDFDRDEKDYRQGFEAALRLPVRGQPYEEVTDYLEEYYPDSHRKEAFRRGYERGRAHDAALKANK
jgi:hypothetical protein